jgi:hypothetical protein
VAQYHETHNHNYQNITQHSHIWENIHKTDNQIISISCSKGKSAREYQTSYLLTHPEGFRSSPATGVEGARARGRQGTGEWELEGDRRRGGRAWGREEIGDGELEGERRRGESSRARGDGGRARGWEETGGELEGNGRETLVDCVSVSWLARNRSFGRIPWA